ncbi:MAG: flagellar hook-length control protein FliK [Nitrospirae bacterium]|nr:flagellar hook-length control protein FliK [Nitrospirota bacterium]
MQIDKILQALKPQLIARPLEATLVIKNGEVLQAEITGRTEKGTLILTTPKGRFEATSTVELKEGGLVRLKAEVSAKQLTLRVIDYKPPEELLLEKKITRLLKWLRPQEAVLKDLLSQASEKPLKDLIPELKGLSSIIKQIESFVENPKTLKEALKHSGIFFESTLKHSISEKSLKELINHDLKAKLLRIKRQIDSLAHEKGISQELRVLKENTEKLLHTIEYYQFKNIMDDTLQLFIPFVWKDLLEGSIEFRKAKGSPKKVLYHCIIKLNLSRHGKLMVVVTQEKGGIHIGMFTEKADFADLLSSNSKVLKERLRRAGLSLRNLIIEKQNEIELIEETITRGLNIRA